MSLLFFLVGDRTTAGKTTAGTWSVFLTKCFDVLVNVSPMYAQLPSVTLPDITAFYTAGLS